MSDQYTCARFWRCALQANPVGYNNTYKGADHGLDEGGYNQALLQKCLELGIKVVGLADHGSEVSVDALRQVLLNWAILASNSSLLMRASAPRESMRFTSSSAHSATCESSTVDWPRTRPT